MGMIISDDFSRSRIQQKTKAFVCGVSNCEKPESAANRAKMRFQLRLPDLDKVP